MNIDICKVPFHFPDVKDCPKSDGNPAAGERLVRFYFQSFLLILLRGARGMVPRRWGDPWTFVAVACGYIVTVYIAVHIQILNGH